MADTTETKGEALAASANGQVYLPLDRTNLKVQSFINHYLSEKKPIGNLYLFGRWRGQSINVPNCPLEVVRRDAFGVYAESAPGRGFFNGQMGDVKVAWLFSGNIVIWLGDNPAMTISTLAVDFRLPDLEA